MSCLVQPLGRPDSRTLRLTRMCVCPASTVRLLLLWTLLLQMVDFLLVVKGLRYSETPAACNFSDFLQPHSPGGGEWTYKYDGYIHVAKVNGGVYTVCSNSPTRSYHEGNDICEKERQICHRQYGPDLYAVEFEELRPNFKPSYQCFRFYRRGEAVVQLAISDRIFDPKGICNLTLKFYHAPWISVKMYKTAVEPCPFTGGINFHDLVEYSKDHDQKTLCYDSYTRSETAPLRLESDCVKGEGFNLRFSHEGCIPKGSHFGKSQRLLCMASWMQDGNGFAVLRKENERAFYCARINYTANNDVKQMIVYLSWMCYRETDFNSYNRHLSIHTNYVRFGAASKTVISLPCRHNQLECRPECRDNRCIRTCTQCLNSSGVATEMDPDVVGSWIIGGPYGNNTMEIDSWSVKSTRLGKLKSVTFDPNERTALRAVLWDHYQNGCYPRFVCMYYDNPAPGLMRYRFSNVISWPTTLHDSFICNINNFKVPPVFGDPESKFEKRPWDIAVTRNSLLSHMPCLYPQAMPEVSAFLDDRNRSGCLTLRSRSSPRSFTIQYVEDYVEPYRERLTYLPEPQYNTFLCVGAMTYIDTYKTVITESSGHGRETLCWMIVDNTTIVVVNTSSCNMQTANGIIRRDPRYMMHLKWQLNMTAAGPELSRQCEINLDTRERNWRARLAQQMENLQEGKRGASRGGKDSADILVVLGVTGGVIGKWLSVLSLAISSRFIQRAVVR